VIALPEFAFHCPHIKAKCSAFKCRLHIYIMSKRFLINPEKKLEQKRLVLFEKNAHFNSKNDVTELKARLL